MLRSLLDFYRGRPAVTLVVLAVGALLIAAVAVFGDVSSPAAIMLVVGVGIGAGVVIARRDRDRDGVSPDAG